MTQKKEGIKDVTNLWSLLAYIFKYKLKQFIIAIICILLTIGIIITINSLEFNFKTKKGTIGKESVDVTNIKPIRR